MIFTLLGGGWTLIKKAWEFLSKLDPRTLLVIALGAALAWQCWTVSTRTSERDIARNQLAGERDAHAVTRASVATLEKAVADQNKAVDELAKAGKRAAVAAQEARQTAIRGNVASLALADRLERSAAPVVGCRTPDAVMKAGL